MTSASKPILPARGAKVFFIGIGGIGMSALAQMLRYLGYEVSGSDRGLEDPGKRELYDQLRAQGIRLFAQDGSGVKASAPDCLIYSAAVESDNADLQAGAALPHLHRAEALAQALNRMSAPQVCVAGSSGKTSVCAWLASALRALGKRILMVNGGYVLDFESGLMPGNFYADENPEYILVEVDESDRSISAFSPDYAVLLNVGHDHYGETELRRVFADFLLAADRAAVLPFELAELCPAGLRRRYFAQEPPPSSGECIPGLAYPESFQATAQGCRFVVSGFDAAVHCRQNGLHAAWNACAVLQTLVLTLPEMSAALPGSLEAFQGVRQRFEVFKNTADGKAKINDYAHNPEKICAAIQAARLRFGSPLAIAFQPHGFGPLGFMRDSLQEALANCLQADDQFIFLPVYYAGGTSSHSPSSSEVAAQYQSAGLQVQAVANRQEAEEILRRNRCKTCTLVLGARDASLRTWTRELFKMQ